MFQNIKTLLQRRPYLMATAAGFLAIVLLIGISGMIASAILIGFIVGLNRAARWQDVFKRFPAALGCFVLVVFLYLLIGTTLGLLRELQPIGTAYIAVFIAPFLLVGEWLGWVLNSSREEPRSAPDAS